MGKAEFEKRVSETLQSLAEEFGGVRNLRASEILLLRKASELVVNGRPRMNPVDQVRHANAITRAIAAVRRGRGARQRLLRLAPR
jgi:hypothetical protein